MNRNATSLSSKTDETIADIARKIDGLVQEVRNDIGQMQEPKAQALLETTAEVLLGLKKAYQDYREGSEKAWQ
jgi:hypothetical protein